jgi:copper chaperone
MTTMTYKVQGMTCEHCVRAVSSELSALDGVSEVVIDLHAGALSDVTVTSAQPLEKSAVRAAVDEAGYELVS